jgi:tRNA(Ile)-lysidine synthase
MKAWALWLCIRRRIGHRFTELRSFRWTSTSVSSVDRAMPDLSPWDSVVNHSAVAAGAWAVGVSGGADSVALLSLLRRRSDLAVHVVHLDHQTRGQASTDDAAFVSELSRQCGLPCTLATRDEMETGGSDVSSNPSARYRALRLALFRKVVEAHGLAGVVLAHHADDQAETVFMRLLRGSGFTAQAGMRERAVVGGVQIVRPLLDVRRETLRAYLRAMGQAWREDASNSSPTYLRNRVRAVLRDNPHLTQCLLDLGRACRDARQWVRQAAPLLGDCFPAALLARQPRIIAMESARRWLSQHGVADGAISSAAISQLLEMANDAASPARQHFPGRIVVARRRGEIHRL